MPHENSKRAILKEWEVAVSITVLAFLMYLVVQYLQANAFHGLSGYVAYFYDIAIIVTGFSVGFVLIRTITHIVDRFIYKKGMPKPGILKSTFQILAFLILMAIILSILGVSIQNLLVGGAVGGVVAGLALQTITPIVLSGALITTSRNLKAGDMVVLDSWVWGVANPKFGRVRQVGPVFTQIRVLHGSITKIPNTILLNSTIITKLEPDQEGLYNYNMSISIRRDVRSSRFKSMLAKKIGSEYSKAGMQAKESHVPEVKLVQMADSSMTYVLSFYFKDIADAEREADRMLAISDEAYWAAKSER